MGRRENKLQKAPDASWRFDENLQFTRSPDIDIEFFRRFIVSEMVVREVIQNSLDARLPEQERIGMLFSFNEVEKNKVQNYFKSLLPHLEAEKIPIKGEKVLTEEIYQEISSESLVKILCIEDHGTTGLDGEISEISDIITNSNFDIFWRGEGISSKNGEKGGRWGQGKTTFHMASKIRSFWGLTIRHSDSKELLMGKALLYPHKIDNKSYQYNGLFSEKNSIPISDLEYIQLFKQKIKCRRDTPRLSLIIPYPVDEITCESVMKAVIIHYFFPIIKKNLRIKIIDTDKTLYDITDSTIIEITESLDWSNTSWEGRNKQYIKELLRFSKECVNLSANNQMIVLPDIVATNLIITEEVLQQVCNIQVLSDNFNNGLQMGFRIPINIFKKDGSYKKTYFDVFLKKYINDEITSSDEHYIRSGISLPEESKRLGSRPIRGILFAEEKTISEFLGDAEEPAHTNWNERRDGFGEKYDQHIKTLRFIRNAMGPIISILDQQISERDYNLLDHIFYIPEEKEEKPEEIEEGKDSKEHEVEPIISKEDEFIINQINNGFSIRSKGKIDDFPVSARLRIAYDVPAGNPFSGYEPFDFDLSSGTIKIEIYNGNILKNESNDIYFELKNRSSNITLSGFDSNRDIIMRITKVRK